jgi:CBS-domain-containing membrane protein
MPVTRRQTQMFDFDVREIGDGELARTAAGGRGAALGTIHLNARIGEIWRAPSLSLAPETGVAAAMAALRRRGARAAVVVQNHRPIGVVSDQEILTACGDTQQLQVMPVRAVMSPCDDPLRDTDSVGAALRAMCARRRWHLPIVCARGLFLGALDVTDLSIWLRDRLVLMSVDAAFAGAGVRS